jgi:hypothetical protein
MYSTGRYRRSMETVQIKSKDILDKYVGRSICDVDEQIERAIK